MSDIRLNRYLLNDKDMFSTYGLVISQGSNDFLKQPKRKEPFSNDWAEHNGKEYDLSTVKFEDREIRLKGWIKSTSESDFWAKYNLLFTDLTVAGTISLKCVELNKTINVFYVEMTNANRYTRISGSTDIKVEVELTLREVQ